MHLVRSVFEQENISVWTDNHIELGSSSWTQDLEDAIRNAGCIVCILSPDANQSKWVRNELDFADLLDKPVFLILARGKESESIPFGFARFQWLDLRMAIDVTIALKPLAKKIQEDFANNEVSSDHQIDSDTSHSQLENHRDKLLYLAQSREIELDRLSTILASMSEGVMMLDNNMRIVLMNQSAKELFGNQKAFWESPLVEIISDISQNASTPNAQENQILFHSKHQVTISTKNVNVQVARVFGQHGANLGYLAILREIEASKADSLYKAEIQSLRQEVYELKQLLFKSVNDDAK